MEMTKHRLTHIEFPVLRSPAGVIIESQSLLGGVIGWLFWGLLLGSLLKPQIFCSCGIAAAVMEASLIRVRVADLLQLWNHEKLNLEIPKLSFDRVLKIKVIFKIFLSLPQSSRLDSHV